MKVHFSKVIVGACLSTIVIACSSSEDQPGTTVTANTGGTPAVGTGGAKATGGATGVVNATGGKAATGGAAPTATGGATAAATGGKAATGGAAPAATGGATAAATGGKAATGGATTAGGATVSATGGATTAGGASATGGSTSAACAAYTGPGAPSAGGAGGATATFCSPTAGTISLSGLCATGCSAGQVTMTGSSAGLTITGTVNSNDPVFYANPIQQTTTGKLCDGFSASDPTTGTAYTSLAIGIKNNMTTSQVINISLADAASNSSSAYQLLLNASVTVAAGATVTQTFKWSNCGTAANCTSFTQSCSLPTGVNFDPTKLLKLGLGLGGTTYPITGVNFTITSVTFS